jgi:AcrR family transcriptional regulator
MLGSVAASRTAERPRPRTQAERRAETRAALLNATIESLITYGYGGTTTGRIAELAGVSRGAQTPYFPSRADLVAAAVQHLADLRFKAYSERIAGREITVEEGLDAIWEEYKGPLFGAVIELWVAARTDPDLREKLIEIEHNVTAAITEVAEESLGPIAKRKGFNDDLVFALATVRGLALLRISNDVSDEALAARWEQARERLVAMFG